MLALFQSHRTVPNVSVYGPDPHFQDQWLNVERCYLIFLHLVVGVSSSVGLGMDIGVFYLSHAVLVLAELVVSSTRGFACILAKWFWPTMMSLSLRYGTFETDNIFHFTVLFVLVNLYRSKEICVISYTLSSFGKLGLRRGLVASC